MQGNARVFSCVIEFDPAAGGRVESMKMRFVFGCFCFVVLFDVALCKPYITL
jgi:hypothetical protein